MADPATRLQRVQRWLRRHMRTRPWSPLRLVAGLALCTQARRERALCGNPLCRCADVNPACTEWAGTDDWPEDRCPRCGAPRSYHDDREDL